MSYKKIDFHTHYLTENYLKALNKNISGDPDGWPLPKWSLNTTLNFMEENNISFSIISLSSPHINFGDKQETLILAENVNKFGGKVQSEHPTKIGFLATLPLPYVEESIEMINKISDEKKAIGFTLPTNSRGIYLGSPILDAVYESLNAHHAIVALHPNELSIRPKDVNSDLPAPLLDFFMDTTMTVLNLIKYKFFDRFPNIRLVIPHAGAFMAILTDRVAGFVQANYETDIFSIMKHCYFDTAGNVLPRQLPALLSLVDPTHILYGSDIPFTPLSVSTKMRGDLEKTPLLTNEQKKAIFYDNAQSLLDKKILF